MSISGSGTIMVLFCRAVLGKWLKPISMAGMNTDCVRDFEKASGFSNLQIVEILQKCCCSVDFFEQIHRDRSSWYRLDYQPLFGKGASVPPPNSSRGGTETRLEKATEIEPNRDSLPLNTILLMTLFIWTWCFKWIMLERLKEKKMYDTNTYS